MKIKINILLFALLPILSCVRLEPCGSFTFTGTEYDTEYQNGVDMNISFDFNPATCSSECTCDPVCYIQIVRTVDLEDGTYLYPSSEKEDRATSDGWYIDRLAGRKWGYYGRNDDGSFASTLDTGSETEPAILYDSPRRGESEPWLNIWWQAVSIPVCIDEDSDCLNNLLGYYFWSWWVTNDGEVPGIINGIAWEPHEVAVDEAVDEWNDQAPGLGKNSFPTFSRLMD